MALKASVLPSLSTHPLKDNPVPSAPQAVWLHYPELVGILQLCVWHEEQ